MADVRHLINYVAECEKSAADPVTRMDSVILFLNTVSP